MNPILLFLIPAAIAVLSGLGIGGGGLLVLFLSEVTTLEQTTLRAANLLFFLFSALGATAVNLKRRTLSPSRILPSSLAGICGVFCGFFLLRSVSPLAAGKVFGWFLILSGLFSLFRKSK